LMVGFLATAAFIGFPVGQSYVARSIAAFPFCAKRT
jgi:hypothetical protein